jgi:hypothetical protein
LIFDLSLKASTLRQAISLQQSKIKNHQSSINAEVGGPQQLDKEMALRC